MILGIIIVYIIWIAYEVWRAPLVDDNCNILIPEKKFKDLFKNKQYARSKNES
jgi:hypothetical protein